MEEEKERLQLENMLANIEREEISMIKNCKLPNYDNELIAKTLDSCYGNSNTSKSEKNPNTNIYNK
jgi:hypothetical protein